MANAGIDQVATIKASLELMVAENEEIHEYFQDLLQQVAALDEEDADIRRQKFRAMMKSGAFSFNGLDVRHFTHARKGPLPPPLFLSRTKRRLKNTMTLVEEFRRRGVFDEAEQLTTELDLLSSHIVNETDNREVLGFKEEVDALRESTLFQSYMATKNAFIQRDEEMRTDAEFIAAKESVEEGEEAIRHRAAELDDLTRQIEDGSMALDEAQAKLDEMSLDALSASHPAEAEAEAGADEVAAGADADDAAEAGAGELTEDTEDTEAEAAQAAAGDTEPGDTEPGDGDAGRAGDTEDASDKPA